eukprot:TRINITY_DN9213_c0_g1_i1.p1 TRINITY_DN9213_c0_g1~~TRINITY_DN9213_c0_g1_i1.p1  ORF type:complete len:519 (+),score=142.73 TRINITY_DN9213_c0_g1_i1:120-1676(+)
MLGRVGLSVRRSLPIAGRLLSRSFSSAASAVAADAPSPQNVSLMKKVAIASGLAGAGFATSLYFFRDPPDTCTNLSPHSLNFDDAHRIYDGKITAEVAQAAIINSITSITPLNALIGPITNALMFMRCHRPFFFLLKHTFYSYYVAGDNQYQAAQHANQLLPRNVHAILVYSAESTLDSDELDRNAMRVVDSIECPIKGSHMASVKPTSIIQPAVLKKLTTFLKDNEMKEVKASKFEEIDSEVFNGFSEQETEQLHRFFVRCRIIADAAHKHQVRVLFDAEHFNMQIACNYLFRVLSREYNKAEPTFYNTYQLYLKDGLDWLKRDHEAAKKAGVAFGAKLVRGAYYKQETELAAKKNYPCPVFDGIEKTNASYNEGVKFLLENIKKTFVIVASHNRESCVLATDIMKQKKIANDDLHVYFGQLMGMSDSVTEALSDRGYNVVKLLPYGPLNTVMPYLLRRLDENREMLTKAVHERDLAMYELSTRMIHLAHWKKDDYTRLYHSVQDKINQWRESRASK